MGTQKYTWWKRPNSYINTDVDKMIKTIQYDFQTEFNTYSNMLLYLKLKYLYFLSLRIFFHVHVVTKMLLLMLLNVPYVVTGLIAHVLNWVKTRQLIMKILERIGIAMYARIYFHLIKFQTKMLSENTLNLMFQTNKRNKCC